MVFITKIVYFAKIRKPPRNYLQAGVIDTLRMYVRGGTGGNGLPRWANFSQTHKYNTYKCYRYGGIGGQGGSVYLVAKQTMTLEKVLKTHDTKQLLAKHGKDSTHNFILGLPGEDIVVEVPLGVTVVTAFGKKLGMS